jgi:ABC-type lipoprotein release transport system permease subunit
VVQAALAQPGVIAASRRIKTGCMVGNREGNFPVAIIGIEPQQEARMSLLAENIASDYEMPDLQSSDALQQPFGRHADPPGQHIGNDVSGDD